MNHLGRGCANKISLGDELLRDASYLLKHHAVLVVWASMTMFSKVTGPKFHVAL